MRPQALVTGGTRGIGKSICIDLAKSGYDVAFTFRSNSSMAIELETELAKLGSKSKGFAADVSKTTELQDQLDQILAAYPNIEVLVNNAGMTIDGLAMRYKAEDFDKIMNTNLRGAFLTTQALLRPMMKARRGSIIFISSTSGQMGNTGQTVYSASKSGLFGMTKSLAKELGSRNIRVNCVAPGFIDTEMTESLPAQSKESILSQIPLGKFGNPEEIAKVVTFLAGAGASYITGEIIAVNGGLYM